eukprot:1668051-Pyramimonas_sp.AAC.1
MQMSFWLLRAVLNTCEAEHGQGLCFGISTWKAPPSTCTPRFMRRLPSWMPLKVSPAHHM